MTGPGSGFVGVVPCPKVVENAGERGSKADVCSLLGRRAREWP